MSKKLYVGNLSYGVDDHMLNDCFAQHGQVTQAQVVMDRETGRSKGFGFVEYSTQEEAQAAIDALDGVELDGRAMRVDEARPREDRPRRGGGGGGGYGGGGGGRW
ncbi:MAG: RNA recognition motif domain-containing protein [Planctomycetota bacterium]|jgi:cold-inducible RNA-binding protein